MNIIKKQEKKEEIYKTRPPIITIMGHVDHGKTSLLNYIMKNNTKKFEHGGITQHIHSYRIKTKYGYMTFIDTPGHSAFDSIRYRGTKLTDIVVIVVAIDDGIMPQTIESIKLAKEEKLPIIIAINKIDKIENKTEKIINDLSKYNLIAEKWGGDTLIAYTSAQTGKGVDELLEQINLQAEMLDLKTNYNCQAKGIIIDSSIDTKKGPIISAILTEGQLKIGDIVISESEYGKVKLMTEFPSTNITIAYPSYPINIVGFQKIPKIGSIIKSIKSEKDAKKITENNKKNTHQNLNKKSNIMDVFEEMQKKNTKKINIILKVDVQGSVEVLNTTIYNISKEKINIIKTEIGGFNQSDLDLAITTKSTLIGFNIKNNYYQKTNTINKNIEIKYFNTIYEIIDYIKNIIEEKTNYEEKEISLGLADIKKVFNIDKNKIIFGCIITEGIIKLESNINVIRKNKIIHKGKLESIKQLKINVNEVTKGSECGIIIKNFNNANINDKIKAYEIIKDNKD